MTNVVPLLPKLSSATLAEDEVTISRLCGLFETAFIEHEVDDDGDILITDGLDVAVWVQIDNQRKLIVLVTQYRVDDEPPADWLARVNDMNATVAVPQFCYRKDAIWGSHWITYDGGLNVRQFIKMLRRFAGAFRAGIELHKSEGVESPRR